MSLLCQTDTPEGSGAPAGQVKESSRQLAIINPKRGVAKEKKLLHNFLWSKKTLFG
jgi:hypothetical protein